MLTRVLTHAGYEVIAVRNGAEAIQALQGGVRPRAIVLDLIMPIMNGWQVWDWLQTSSQATVPVIVFTASGLSQGAFGPVRVLQKGRTHELLDALRAAAA